ncbi:MAG: glycosyl hydrolase [Cyclobacteriaceae bacterium]|nr:glycosyl hydrolase [Cyclobacteriaceae bacterium]
MNKLAFIFFMALNTMVAAQNHYTTGDDIQQSIEEREGKREASIFKNYPVRNVGPVVQGGRISDIAVNPQNSKQYYVAFASGGVFKTVNNGITFTPVFDHQGNLTIGDIVLSPSDPDQLWVGTGENNSSRSSYAGSGIYKSLDGGTTWSFVGLEAIQHTGRIIIHPDDPQTVWVAAMGNLYSHNPERGVYKTVNGGQTWDKTLFLNDSTGAIDLLIHPEEPDVLWATMWERTRKAWDFKGHGPGSGIYKSEDGGNTWRKVMKGIKNPGMAGRIGIDICRSQPQILYALVDNQMETKKEKERNSDEFLPGDFIRMEPEIFLALDNDKLNDFLKNNDFPEKYTAEMVKQEIRAGKYKPDALTEYLGDANTALFEAEITGAEIYKSVDSGESWEITHDFWLEGVYYTYGYYFGEIRISPNDPEKIFVFGVPLLKSTDGGGNFHRIDTIGDVHADHQAMWINPEDPAHILLGNDGGLYVTYDEGAAWEHINNIPAGQFYTVNVDMEIPYNIYGGLQDNGILYGPSNSVPNETKPWEYLFGGDGMFVIPDPRNIHRVYLGYQFGNYYRLNTRNGRREFIAPKHDIGEDPLRYNWRTPLVMSDHNPDILYVGAQKIFRTMDRGEHWKALSGDLTRDLENGNVPYSTITCIEESPESFGLLYVGTDDGLVQVSRNGGYNWDLKTVGLPEKKWVTCLFASPHRESKVYLSLTGYREDDFSTYVYRSNDYGDTWESISGNIHHEGVNVILEDPVTEGLLYLGTDHGIYLSFKDGNGWHLMAPVPNVATYDMVIHPKAHDLVVGTHGRSIYVLPLEPVREIAGKDVNHDFVVFSPEKIRHTENWGEKRYPFSNVNRPACRILYFSPEPGGKIMFEVFLDGIKVREESFTAADKGFNYFNWDLKINPADDKKISKPDTHVYAPKGKYEVKFTFADQVGSAEIIIE